MNPRPSAVRVYPDELTDGARCWVAEHPALRGCVAHADTIEDAKLRLDQAREAYLQHLVKCGEPVPAPDAPGVELVSGSTMSDYDAAPDNVELFERVA